MPWPANNPAIAAFDRLPVPMTTYLLIRCGPCTAQFSLEQIAAAFPCGERVLELTAAPRGCTVLPRAGFRGCLRRFGDDCRGKTKACSAALRLGLLFKRFLTTSELPLTRCSMRLFQFLPDQLRAISAMSGGQSRKTIAAGAWRSWCVSTRFCLWEIAGFFAGQPRKAFRRSRACNRPHSQERCSHLYQPCGNGATLAPPFRLCSVRAIGLSCPPSYAENGDGHRRRSPFLEQLDRRSALGQF